MIGDISESRLHQRREGFCGRPALKFVTVGGMRVATASRSELTEHITLDCLASRQKDQGTAKLMFDANGHAISMRATNSEYRNAVDQADLIHADGQFLIPVSRYLCSSAIAERSATIDLIHDLALRSEESGLSFFLLGSDQDTVSSCASSLASLYPKLRIAGFHHGYYSEDEQQSVFQKINESGADIVWIGLGKPKEQLVSVAARENIDARWLITCGGCFNYITGSYKRAPIWMQKSGIEWIHRMLTNPKNLLLRYLITTPHALYISLTQSR